MLTLQGIIGCALYKLWQFYYLFLKIIVDKPIYCFFYRLALYVYEYLLHVGAQKAAQTFLNEVSYILLIFFRENKFVTKLINFYIIFFSRLGGRKILP